MTERLFLDHNATTPLCTEARDTMVHAMSVMGNASSIHADGRAQRKVVEDAREKVAALAGVSPANIIFTSGGSEANNAILRGTSAERILSSSVEHASVIDAVADAGRISVDDQGVLDRGELRHRLSDKSETKLVSVMVANNETGVIQPIEEIAGIVHENGAKLHVDAVQAAGKIDLSSVAAVADAITISAHKINGPQGVGAIIVRDGFAFEPLVRGGGQERRRRAGTENVIGIAGFGAAAEKARVEIERFRDIANMRDHAETALKSQGAIVYGNAAERLANTSSVRMPGVSAETQLMAFDLAGISVSAGSACSSGKVEPSHVLLAMGISVDDASETIRVSFGKGQSISDADRFVAAWRAIKDRAAVEAA